MTLQIKWISLIAFATFMASCSTKVDPTKKPANPENPLTNVDADPVEGNPFDADPRGSEIVKINDPMNPPNSNGPINCLSEKRGLITADALSKFFDNNVQRINFCIEAMSFDVYTRDGLALNKFNTKAYLMCQITDRNQMGFQNPMRTVGLKTRVEEIVRGKHYRIHSEGESSLRRNPFQFNVRSRDVVFGQYTTAMGCGYRVQFVGDIPDRNGNVGSKFKGDVDGAVKNPKTWDDLTDLDGFLKRDDLTAHIRSRVDGMCVAPQGAVAGSFNGKVVRAADSDCQ